MISHLTEPRSIGNLKATLGAIVLNTVLSTTALKQSSQPQTLPRNFAQEFFKTYAAKTEPMWYVLLSITNLLLASSCLCDLFKRTSTKTTGTLWLALNNHRLRRCPLPHTDYGFTTTTPLPGETLATGSWLRWYHNRLLLLSQVVRSGLSYISNLPTPYTHKYTNTLLNDTAG